MTLLNSSWKKHVQQKQEVCEIQNVFYVSTNYCSMADLAFFVLNFYKYFFVKTSKLFGKCIDGQ